MSVSGSENSCNYHSKIPPATQSTRMFLLVKVHRKLDVEVEMTEQTGKSVDDFK